MKEKNKKLMLKKIKVFSGSSYPALAEEICKQLGIPLSSLETKKYKNGCFEVILKGNIQDKRVFIIQTSLPNENLLHKHIWELYQIVEAAVRSNAKEVIVIMPYVSYARSDKRYKPNMAINGELLVKILEKLGMKGFIGINPHSSLFKDFFYSANYVRLVSAESLIIDRLKKMDLQNTILLSGDASTFPQASYMGEQLGIPVGRVEKERINDSQVRIKIIGREIMGKNIIIFDDEISTGTTIITLIKEAKKKGAKKIIIATIHGLFAGDAVRNLQKIEDLEQIIVTDTVPISKEARESLPLIVISVAGVLAEEIKKFSGEQ